MKKEHAAGLPARYVWHHRKSLILLLLSILIFLLVFSAYRLEWEAVWYAAVLCAALWVLAAGIDLYRYGRRHRQMKQLISSGTSTSDASAAGTQLLPDLRLLPAPCNLVEEDYQELAGALLTERQQLIREYDRAKQERADYDTLWAHQIKTPIAAMRLLLQEQDTPEYRELSAQLFQMEQYVEMILSYMRLDSQTNDFVFRNYSLDDRIKQAVRKYAGQFVRRKLALEREDTGVYVLTDEKWLVFVLEQLISNALKYTPSGGVSIRLAEVPQENSVTLVIEDTGIGIAAEDLPRIFEKGYTGLNGRADKKSTGIGLYLCRRILDRLGHGIKVESEIGKGTRVYLTFYRNSSAQDFAFTAKSVK